jgi:succinate dehydrogenase flavin-adding protein (antitoxin of CptAB toxin-antitoxin module)
MTTINAERVMISQAMRKTRLFWMTERAMREA